MQEKIDWEWDKLLEKSKINNSKKILKKSEKNREMVNLYIFIM